MENKLRSLRRPLCSDIRMCADTAARNPALDMLEALVGVLAFGLVTLVLAPAAVQAQTVNDGADCQYERDRSESTRRRAGGANRECLYIEAQESAAQEQAVGTADGDIESRVVMRDRPVAPRRVSPVPRPKVADYDDPVLVPDRWRIVDTLGYEDRWWDPYNQNTIKGDKPIHDDWFFNVTAISDSVAEVRQVPTPVGGQTTLAPGKLDVLGQTDQWAVLQTLAAEFVYYQGDTVFRPPDWEFRFTPVINVNYTEVDEILALNVNPDERDTRTDTHIGVQALFVDKHLRNVSDRYDFDSLRVGIQPFSSDFRGFLFQDSPFGVRLFGTRANNRFQYNLGWFRRLEKDTNSGLNSVSEDLRDEDIFVANLYWQDQPTLGFFSQLTAIYLENRETDVFYDQNGFIARPASIGLEQPREYDVTYLGYNGDGHFDRLNVTVSAYVALGEERASVFDQRDSDIEAYFFAIEPSMDFDWLRLRASLLYASGDSDPFDGKSEGFDAIFENPQFAGADTSYWIRQSTPLIGGGRVALSSRNGVLNSLRPNKEHGQANFTNPGTVLAGIGADMDLLPELRLSLNANYLAFADTAVLEAARAQGRVDDRIGTDLSAALIWRPLMSQNVVVRLSYAQLLTASGFENLYGQEDPYSFLANVILTF